MKFIKLSGVNTTSPVIYIAVDKIAAIESGTFCTYITLVGCADSEQVKETAEEILDQINPPQISRTGYGSRGYVRR